MTWVVFALAFEGAGFPERGSRFEKKILHRCGGAAAARLGALLNGSRTLPERVVLAGLAGALNPALSVGDVLVCGNSAALPCRGVAHTVTHIVHSAARKEELWKQTGADCVDLETREIATICEARGIPFVSIRSISDTAAEDLPLPGEVLFHPVKMRPAVCGIFCFLITHPHKAPGFFRMVRKACHARRRLHLFLKEFIECATTSPA